MKIFQLPGRPCLALMVFALIAIPPVQAQLSAAALTPPMRADTTLNGAVSDVRDSGTLAACLALCQAQSGCTGFSWSRSAATAKSSCRRLTGVLTDAAQAGVISCRMPCAPVSRVSQLLQKPPPPILSAPAVLLPTAPVAPASPASGAKK